MTEEEQGVLKIVQGCTELWYSQHKHTSEADLYSLVTKVTRDWLEMADNVYRARAEIAVFNAMRNDPEYWSDEP